MVLECSDAFKDACRKIGTCTEASSERDSFTPLRYPSRDNLSITIGNDGQVTHTKPV